MNNVTFLLKLTENDKRLVLTFVIILIAILSLLIIFALIIEKIAKKQAQRIDILMHDIVVAGMVDSKRKFIGLANKKSMIYFYRHARIGAALIALHFISATIYLAIFKDYTYAGLYTNYELYGFATILPIYDLNNVVKTDFFGMFEIITGLGEPISTPHFAIEALYSYISIPVLIIGGCMFLFQVQGFLARTIRTHRLANKIYSKKLDNVRYNGLAGIKYVDNVITIENQTEQTEKKE